MDNSPDSDRAKPNASSSLGGLHYLLIFSAFGLLGLVLMGPKYQQRQEDLEQQFKGIRQIQKQEQQRNIGSGGIADPRFEQQAITLDSKPSLIITLRPLMLAAAVVMLLAWAGLQWRRMQRAAPPGSTPHSAPSARDPLQP